MDTLRIITLSSTSASNSLLVPIGKIGQISLGTGTYTYSFNNWTNPVAAMLPIKFRTGILQIHV